MIDIGSNNYLQGSEDKVGSSSCEQTTGHAIWERRANDVHLRIPNLPNLEPVQDINEICQSEGLLEKWSNLFSGRMKDPIASAYTDYLSISYFWFTLISWIYLMLTHYIPDHYADWEPMSRYYLKVCASLIFIQIAANFICVRFYDSFIHKTDDTPHTERNISNGNQRATVVSMAAVDKTGFVGRFCHACQLHTPYRAHHCIICRKCVLKRDHHCFFTGLCIGLTNQRYFTVMCFYITIGCVWGMLEVIPSVNETFAPTSDKWDYFLPVTCFRWLVGWISFNHVLMIWQLYSIWWMGFTTFGFFVWNMFIIMMGQTSHEVRTKVNVRSTATISERFQFVFGPFWLTSFMFPSVLIFRQQLDGKKWPDLRKC